MQSSRTSLPRDDGFTLVELLVTIIVLGVLATIVVFAVRGVTDQGQVSAIASDERTVIQAEESHMALKGEYGTEADLVGAGLLREESAMHDVTVDPDGEGYTIAYVGDVPPPAPGGGSGGAGGPSGSTPATTVPAQVAEVTTFAGMDALAYGSGPVVLFIDSGSGNGEALYDYYFEQYAASTPAPTSYRIVVADAEGALNSGAVTVASIVSAAQSSAAFTAVVNGQYGNDIATGLYNAAMKNWTRSGRIDWGLSEVLDYYEEMTTGRADAVPTVVNGRLALRRGAPNAAHEIIVVPIGGNATALESAFWAANVAPDTSITLVGIGQVQNDSYNPGMLSSHLRTYYTAGTEEVIGGAGMAVYGDSGGSITLAAYFDSENGYWAIGFYEYGDGMSSLD